MVVCMIMQNYVYYLHRIQIFIYILKKHENCPPTNCNDSTVYTLLLICLKLIQNVDVIHENVTSAKGWLSEFCFTV